MLNLCLKSARAYSQYDGRPELPVANNAPEQENFAQFLRSAKSDGLQSSTVYEVDLSEELMAVNDDFTFFI